ncbi:MAG TPA: class I lanthipeptide [Thermoanaerobaculia bacterium]|nr:class I lanthipeptide [Thermoanaerobaculia bacterium]
MKKQIKKLVLAKETLRSLEDKDAKFVNGGQSGSICGNPTCIQDCGTTTC